MLVSRVLYWGIRKWLAEFGVAWGLGVEFVDTTDLAAVGRALRPGRTRLVWVETPANPTLDVTDLAAVVELTHAADARVAVDSTLATPALTRPIEFGADLVVHSATKFLNGHSDVLAGAIVTRTRDPFWERVRAWRRSAGAVPGPFEAWLLQRGMRTLFLRVRRASESALALARHFAGHRAVTAVLYPGLASHPGHAVAAHQMTGGFGGMLALRLAGGETDARAVAAAVRVIKRATSLGGTESLLEHRRSTEGPSSPVPEDLLRLSIGLEAVDDLRCDLEAALDEVARAGSVRPPAVPPEPAPSPPTGRGIEARLAAAIEGSIAPLVIARGGALRVLGVRDGIVTLQVSGTPGAALPAAAHIEEALRAAVPEVLGVRFASTPGAEPRVASGDIAQRVERTLDDKVNPAVAAHGGRVAVVGVVDGRVTIRLDGGCQGCSLAEVTVRQGVERLLRTHIPEITAVVDVTDHGAGTRPYFTPGKR